MKRLPKKIQLKLECKSKLTSSDWIELGKMARELQAQERQWLDAIARRQLHDDVCTFRWWSKLTVKEAKAVFKHDDLLLVARDLAAAVPIAFCAVERKLELGWATCDLLFVKKEWRGKGIAGALVEMALNEIKKDGLESLDLRVSVKNKEALLLYKKLGFSKTAFQMERWTS